MNEIIQSIREGFRNLLQMMQVGLSNILKNISGSAFGSERPRRLLVIDIEVPANTAAGDLFEADIALDREFNKIVAIGFFEIADGGVPGNYNVGARSNRRTWFDNININAWNANENVGPMEKYYKTDIDYGSGDTFFARIVPNAATNAALEGQMVLILEKTLVELPK